MDVELKFMTLQDQESGFNTHMCYEEIMMIQFGSHFCPNMGIAHRIFPDFGAQKNCGSSLIGVYWTAFAAGVWCCTLCSGSGVPNLTVDTSDNFDVFFFCLHSSELCKNTVVTIHVIHFIPKGSMHGIFTYIWLNFMVNVGKYTIHGSYGI